MKMQRAFRGAGRPGGEPDDGRVIGGCVDGGEVVGFALHRRLETVGAVSAEIQDMFEIVGAVVCLRNIFGEIVVGNRDPDFRLTDHVDQFAFAQNRHGRDGNAASLENGKPRSDQHRVVAAADKNPFAGHETVILDQHIRDPVHSVHQVAIGPHFVAEHQGGFVRISGGDLLIYQLDGDVEAGGVGRKFRQDRIIHFRPEFGAGHVVPDKGIHM